MYKMYKKKSRKRKRKYNKEVKKNDDINNKSCMKVFCNKVNDLSKSLCKECEVNNYVEAVDTNTAKAVFHAYRIIVDNSNETLNSLIIHEFINKLNIDMKCDYAKLATNWSTCSLYTYDNNHTQLKVACLYCKSSHEIFAVFDSAYEISESFIDMNNFKDIKIEEILNIRRLTFNDNHNNKPGHMTINIKYRDDSSEIFCVQPDCCFPSLQKNRINISVKDIIIKANMQQHCFEVEFNSNIYNIVINRTESVRIKRTYSLELRDDVTNIIHINSKVTDFNLQLLKGGYKFCMPIKIENNKSVENKLLENNLRTLIDGTMLLEEATDANVDNNNNHHHHNHYHNQNNNINDDDDDDDDDNNNNVNNNNHDDEEFDHSYNTTTSNNKKLKLNLNEEAVNHMNTNVKADSIAIQALRELHEQDIGVNNQVDVNKKKLTNSELFGELNKSRRTCMNPFCGKKVTKLFGYGTLCKSCFAPVQGKRDYEKWQQIDATQLHIYLLDTIDAKKIVDMRNYLTELFGGQLHLGPEKVEKNWKLCHLFDYRDIKEQESGLIGCMYPRDETTVIAFIRKEYPFADVCKTNLKQINNVETIMYKTNHNGKNAHLVIGLKYFHTLYYEDMEQFCITRFCPFNEKKDSSAQKTASNSEGNKVNSAQAKTRNLVGTKTINLEKAENILEEVKEVSKEEKVTLEEVKNKVNLDAKEVKEAVAN